MEAIRKILADAQDSVTVELPPSFRHRPIEVVVMPLDADPASGNAGAPGNWPADFFGQVAGGWSGAPLTREPQGAVDPRAPLD